MEHSIIAAKKGSLLNLVGCFLAVEAAAPAGGNGRRWPPEDSVFLKPWRFFGIPGVCSQEKGIPFKFRGVLGLCGGDELLKKNGDDSEEELEEFEREEEEKDEFR